jgi:TRAP-type mannitol/chloroaromatic compound transport system permease small subunit
VSSLIQGEWFGYSSVWLILIIMLNGTWDIVVENEHGYFAWEFY